MYRYKQRKGRQRSWRMLSAKLLCFGFRRNRGKVAEIVFFATVGNGFQVFGISTVGDADTGDLALFCHIYCLMFLYNGIVGKLIPGDSAVHFHKPDDAFRIGFRLGDLIQGLLCKFLSVLIHRSFGVRVCRKTENMQVYKGLSSVIYWQK